MKTDTKSLRREAARRVNRYRDELTGITQTLVKSASVNPPGDYERMSRQMFEYYSAEGLHPAIACAPRERVEELGLAYPRPNVIALLQGNTHSPVFCLDAHMDVVGVGDESRWTYPPFAGEVHDGKIYGRGAADTKAHLAAQLIAVRVIKEMGVELSGDLIVCSTVDDEIGAWPGIGFLLERGFEQHGFRKPDYHIVGEPTGLESVGCLARGRLWYEYTLKGRAAHGGNPKEGVNAIEKAMTLARAVKSYGLHAHPLMGEDTINIGMLHGGQAINVVPSQCTITFDIRPSTPTEVVKAFMESTVDRLKKEDPDFVVEEVRLLNDRQTGGIGPEHEFVKRVQAVVWELTGRVVIPTGNMGGYSSLGNAYWSTMSGAAGLMYGGGDFQRAHRVDEYITIEELVETTIVFTGLIIEVCA